jgi:hypothetical protein
MTNNSSLFALAMETIGGIEIYRGVQARTQRYNQVDCEVQNNKIN